jgi:hypothetical protein
MMHGPIFNIQLKAKIIFLEEIRSAAKRTHEWFHNLPSDPHRRQAHKPEGMKIFSSSPLAAIPIPNMTKTAVPFSGACALQQLVNNRPKSGPTPTLFVIYSITEGPFLQNIFWLGLTGIRGFAAGH